MNQDHVRLGVVAKFLIMDPGAIDVSKVRILRMRDLRRNIFPVNGTGTRQQLDRDGSADRPSKGQS